MPIFLYDTLIQIVGDVQYICFEGTFTLKAICTADVIESQ